jgi:hypothetical protein
MITAQFITSDYIYKYTIIETNVDADLITKMIWKAQQTNMQEILGTNLYTKMVNDTPNFTGQYLTLMNTYIQPALAEWAVYHLTPFINYRFTNKAVSTKSSDNSQPSNLDDLKWLRAEIRNNAEFMSEQIKDYIKNNSSLFPEYFQRINPFDLAPNKTNYFSGIATTGRIVRAPLPPLNNINPDDFCCP